jgi:hypothetical protein
MIMEARRKIVGETLIVTERIKKSRQTRNVLTETVIRESVKALVLECEHKIPVTKFNKVPTNNTRCYECEMVKENNEKIQSQKHI